MQADLQLQVVEPYDYRHAVGASPFPPAEGLARVHASHSPRPTLTRLLRVDDEMKPDACGSSDLQTVISHEAAP